MSNGTRVFVYGTLKKGLPNCITRIAPGAILEGPAQVQGQLRQHGIPYLLPFGATFFYRLQGCSMDVWHQAVQHLPHLEAPQPWVAGATAVHGEVWHVPPKGLERLDMLEGVHRFNNGLPDVLGCHYLPVQVLARMDNGNDVVAMAYSYNVMTGPERWRRLAPVPTGNYTPAYFY